jgi:hypothetical protein
MTATSPVPTAAREHHAMLDHYRRQSPITAPGRHEPALQGLPRDVAELVEVIGGVFAHYEFDLPGTGFTMPPERRFEVDLRHAHLILDRILAMGAGSLERSRSLDARYLGVCRDAGVLLTSILRAQGIPARLRYGLTRHLFDPRRPFHDHVLVEYWSDADARWKLAEPRAYRSVRDAHGIPDHYRADVPEREFLSGRDAWLAVQHSDAVAFRFSGYQMDADAGRWLARNLFLYDMASLAGWEPLMWDAWGYILRRRERDRPRGIRQHRTLNQLAALDPRDPAQWAQLLAHWRRRRAIRVPARVLCCSPLNGRRLVASGMA